MIHVAIPEETVEGDVNRSNQPSRRNTSMNLSKTRVAYTDFPSTKYTEIERALHAVTLGRAQAAPRPTLPRRAAIRTWNATAKERNPLGSCLTGPGRAGKFGELITEKGSRYEGEVLAGRPHGYGKYFVSKATGWLLEYEGDWIQGIRQGHGIREYVNGEQYDGDFVAGARHGHGRYSFTNGDVYAGEWVDDRRTGHGTYLYSNGDIFVGNFIKDRKEGRGTLFMIGKLRKYIAEYVGNVPKCGTVLEIEDSDLEPLRGQMRDLTLTSKLDLASAGVRRALMPDLELQQPNKVLGVEVVALRKLRTELGGDMKLVQVHSGTLSDREIEMLRHSFTLMAAGDKLDCGLLPHQLRELVVMAGLDPAAPATRQLVELLLERRGPSEQHYRINFDDFMKVLIYFQEESTQVHPDMMDNNTMPVATEDEGSLPQDEGLGYGASDEALEPQDEGLGYGASDEALEPRDEGLGYGASDEALEPQATEPQHHQPNDEELVVDVVDGRSLAADEAFNPNVSAASYDEQEHTAAANGNEAVHNAHIEVVHNAHSVEDEAMHEHGGNGGAVAALEHPHLSHQVAAGVTSSSDDYVAGGTTPTATDLGLDSEVGVPAAPDERPLASGDVQHVVPFEIHVPDEDEGLPPSGVMIPCVPLVIDAPADEDVPAEAGRTEE
ncbi:hypothetical protein CEUSTIGMA_g11015.t1 [Chlamydomonas eustigma]|uniref:MORN repeat-containing protein 3 n=1 Tax=Chlamydomonas eustigma TaxID=1157962 RepID=A0A250XLD1_9CHLO|nr:hypothetical protein CEUSTIGMA_g11015.t1 [Chlamydomonas eustigma]|eukprot:GAX83590.1 hypothetical protein CEUSTIGMA_g11015.t1 [Chlamydomonas eustigma]